MNYFFLNINRTEAKGLTHYYLVFLTEIIRFLAMTFRFFKFVGISRIISLFSVFPSINMLKSLQFADGGKFSFPVFDYYYNVYFINGRDYETELIHLASKINQDFVFFDGGANMGYISSTFLHISKCCKKVVSIEPNPNLLPILKFNLDDVQSTNNFSIVSKAISNKSDVIDNFVIQRHAGSGLAKNGHSGGNSISIETVSLNELIEDFSRPSCFNLIKLDLEGAEFDALEGFNFFYNSALIIEFLNAEGELEKLEKLIQLHDFEVYHFANNAWKLLSEHDKKLLDPTRSLQKQGINFVFIPKELTIQL